MMDNKNTDSISTVQMKAEYAASEIYSTASEAPPAYPMREASSVKIAKIIALTIIASSLIIGSFILASVYMQARASCDQMQALDSMLEKELMLETLQQELPKAEALLRTIDADLKHDDSDDTDEKVTNPTPAKKSTANDESSQNAIDHEFDTDSSYSESDETSDLNRVNVKLPLELNLSELAHSILQNQQKSRMNCVIERRQAEEFVEANGDSYSNRGEPTKRVTGERMAIFCESGTEVKTEPQAEQIPAVMMRPSGRYPIPYGAIPQHFPLTHMPMQMEPQQHQMPPPPPPQQQQQPQQPQTLRLMPQILVRQIHIPSQMQFQMQQQQQQQQRMHEQQEQQQRIQEQMRQRMEPPPQMPQQQQPFHMPAAASQSQQLPPFFAVRHTMPISIQRIIPQPINQMLTAPQRPSADDRQIPFPIRNEIEKHQREMISQGIVQSVPVPHGVQLQRVPLSLALQRVGITPDDLRNIQRMAEERIQHEVQQLANDYSDSPSSSSSSSSSSQSQYEDSSEESSENENRSGEDSSPILQIGRSAFGRSVVTPMSIPVDLLQAIKQVESMASKQVERMAAKADDDTPAQDAPLQGPVRINQEPESPVAENASNGNHEESQQ